MSKRKLITIGWDGADWQIINPLLKAGKMPSLQKLIENGVSGNIRTLNPPFSPMLWTSIATGKTPEKHGVMGFVELEVEKQVVRPVTVSQRKVRALWNIFSHEGMKTNLVGWWPTHPAEPINGTVVTNEFGRAKQKYGEPWEHVKGSIHPEEMIPILDEFRLHPQEITGAHILPFIPKAASIKEEDQKGLQMLAKMTSQSVSLHAASTYLAEETEWDFMAVYHEYIDHMCHGFMKYHPPRLSRVPEKEFELYKDVVNGTYMFQDMMLGRILDIIDDDTAVMVLSDHGYISDSNRILDMPKLQAAPALEHREFGMFVMSGPGIKKGEKIYGASILDVTPTILHYYGKPVGEDMDGIVLAEVFEDPKVVKTIPSWEAIDGEFGMHKNFVEGDPLSDHDAMEQLIELGYVDKPEENIADAMHKVKLHNKHNLARVHLGRGERDKAERILVELLDDEKGDRDMYLVDLIHMMTHSREFDRARNYLHDLKLVNSEAASRSIVAEAKILIGEGAFKQAKALLDSVPSHQGISGSVHYELGKLYVRFESLEDAIVHFRKAIELNPDRAKYHHSLAKCLFLKNELEPALDAAMKAIELVRYFPQAHYTIGQILEKLGEKEAALEAFSFANQLNPDLKRPKHAVENLKRNISEVAEMHSEFGEITIVSGLPRSGTSMMMQMLHAGGVSMLTDGIREQDENNPKGYFEYEKTKGLMKDNSWLHEAEGKGIKVIAQLLKFLPADYRYKIIFMERDLDEVMASQRKMRGMPEKLTEVSIRASYEEKLNAIFDWAERQPFIDLIRVPYAEVVANPETQIDRVHDFLGQQLDKKAMQEQVESKLYRNKRISFK